MIVLAPFRWSQGLITGPGILKTIGIILLVIGFVLMVAGGMCRTHRGRRHYF